MLYRFNKDKLRDSLINIRYLKFIETKVSTMKLQGFNLLIDNKQIKT